MGGKIDKTLFVDAKGKRIYVCCGGCVAAVKKDPEGALKKLAKLGEKAEDIPIEQKTCPVMGGPINKDLFVEYKGKKIYVCCEGCINVVKKDPEKYAKKVAEEIAKNKTEEAKKDKAEKSDSK
ncbi:MAG: hypothetical protein JXR97_15870 [Planctomycetes bacterium]|nr:hypothetical protein [Planctomycetota bacterium]